jgi:hypothetical protein
VLSESLPVAPRLREFAIGLLGPIGWHGLAMIEYKQDSRTGEAVLMEVNGRFWGSLELAVDAGVDFPHLAFQLARGRAPQGRPRYEIGVRNRWLLGDLDHLLLRLRRSARALDLPDGAPSTSRVLLDFLRFVQPKLHYDVLDAADLRPFVHEIGQYLRGLSGGFARPRRRPAVARTEPLIAGAHAPAAQRIET